MMLDSESVDRRVVWLSFSLPIVLLLPFVMKSYHADDHVFVWVVEQILRAPLDFYGFSIDYGLECVYLVLGLAARASMQDGVRTGPFCMAERNMSSHSDGRGR